MDTEKTDNLAPNDTEKQLDDNDNNNNAECLRRSAESSSPQNNVINSKSFAFVDEKTKSGPRRSRARRNPVWQYFRVQDGVATCTNCDYHTKSVYSTNLKVHLKSHHSPLYDLVRKAEEATEVGCFSNGVVQIMAQNFLPKSPSNGETINYSNSDGESNFVEGKILESRPSTREGMSSTSPQPINNSESKTPTLDSILSVPTLFFGGPETNCSSAMADFTSENFENIFRNLSNCFTSSANATFTSHNDNENAHAGLGDAVRNFINLPVNLPPQFSPTTSTHQSLDFLSKNLPNLMVNANSNSCNGESNAARPPSTDENNFGIGGELLADGFRTKRKRLRRHPVWRFFKDVEDKTVGCATCNFKTRSAFSTNLKMHLRAHHKEQYLAVMEMELEQCNLENTISTTTNDFEASSTGGVEFPSPPATQFGRLKRKRKSVEEIQCIINKCKVGLAKERQRRSSSDASVNGITVNSTFSANNVQAPFGEGTKNNFMSADAQNKGENSNNSMLSAIAILHALQKTKPPHAEGISPLAFPAQQTVATKMGNNANIEQLNTMIGMILKRNAENLVVADGNGLSSNCDNNNNNDVSEFKHPQQQTKAEMSQQFSTELSSTGDTNACENFSSARSSPIDSLTNGAANFASNTSASQLEEIRRLFDFCKATDNHSDKLLRSVVLKQAIDLTFVKLVEALGTPKILSVPAFRLLISVILPDYDWSSIDRDQASAHRE